MNILITGGAGFIGSHLTEYLLNQGHFVIVLDNFFTGSRENLAHLKDNKNLRVIEHDIITPLPNPLPLPMGEGNLDQIYNLACPASTSQYQKNPIATIQANVLGTLNMLELAKARGAKILQASTSEVYGDPQEHPQKESYLGNVNPVGPRACYDEGKRCAETLCFDYFRQSGVEIRVIRIFNTYGPRMAEDDGRVVSNFIVQALRGDDLTIYGDGSGTRSFQYVDDLISGMTKMMAADNFQGPVNLGNPDEIKIRELADKVLALTGSKSGIKIKYMAKPIDDPVRRRPDISLAKEKLAWQPAVALDNGLKKTIEYFRARLKR